jgi:hypothetical protein
MVADLAARGVLGAATELRQRERIIGRTVDARRDLRFRYVPAIDGEPVSERDAAIADLVAYREAVRRERQAR